MLNWSELTEVFSYNGSNVRYGRNPQKQGIKSSCDNIFGRTASARRELLTQQS